MKVLITGGSRGIGFETARLFRKNNAEVWICGRDGETLKLAGEALGALSTVADVGRPGDVATLFDEVKSAWGKLDVLVNNAADIFACPLEHMDLERVRSLYDVNVFGLMDCCRRAIPLLRSGENPSIVNVASIGGVQGRGHFAGFSAYNPSKAAVIGITEVLSAELSEDGIRVNAVSPGRVDTEMLNRNIPKEFKPQMTAEEVAQTIWFLATPASRPMNGRNVELF